MAETRSAPRAPIPTFPQRGTENAAMQFHPAVSGWLTSRFGRPTEVQTRAWAVTTQHRHALIAAPTGSGKTLTSTSGRAMLKSVKSVIVDELHAVAGVKRGAHLTLSLERLAALCERPPVRIGLSATVKPLAEMARFLIGERADEVEIIDAGHI